jgi:hypothetical protein
MKTFDCPGIWWLPEDSSKKVAGTLRFSDEKGVDLSLAGVFAESSTTLEKDKIPIVLGQIWDCALGETATLTGCQLRASHFGSHAIPREEYSAERLFIGSHMETEGDFSFSKLSIQLSGLPSWANTLRGLSIHHIPADEARRRGFEIRWLLPEPVAGRIPGADLTLSVGAKIASDRRQHSIKEEVKFAISCDTPASDHDLNARLVYPLQNFMTFATDTPNAIVDYTVTRHGTRDDVHVLGARVFHDCEAAADLSPFEMLFSLSDVKDRVIDLLASWIDISQRLRDACNLYFRLQYQPDSFIETRLLLVCQFLEVYQRERQPAITDDRGPDDMVFGEQLERLLEEHRTTVGPLFGNEIQVAVAELMKYRNYVICRDFKAGADSDYGAKMFWLTQKLMFLMKACLLAELGINSEEQLKFFEHNGMYVHLLGLVGD